MNEQEQELKPVVRQSDAATIIMSVAGIFGVTMVPEHAQTIASLFMVIIATLPVYFKARAKK